MPSVVVPGRFAYVHMPKTAGTYFSRALAALGLVGTVEANVTDAIDAHSMAWQARIAAADVPIVGTVRDPWSWYFSLYHYWLDRDGLGETGHLYPYVAAVGRHRSNVIGAMVDPVGAGVKSIGSLPPPEETLRGDGMGLYTFNVLRSYCTTDWFDLDPDESKGRLHEMFLLDYGIDQASVYAGLRTLVRASGAVVPECRWRKVRALGRVLDSGWSHDAEKACPRWLRESIDKSSAAARAVLGYTGISAADHRPLTHFPRGVL